ncbi:anti-sigma factor [Paraflavitalea pollutisoli]|uniref:anti-sigma factor n=1 Tax=Paraflavitalea pollutisoli TaxID=3034143 RepID=UPI0023EB00B2|nr:anti-sigma factor [Paraflavitalea sp. H1-2-19X]
MDIQAYIESGVIESYVLGIANEAEVAELQRLQQQHPEVADAIVACEQWLRNTADRYAAPVPLAGKDQLWAALQASEEQTTSPAIKPTLAPVRSLRPAGRYLAAASLILLAGSIALNIYFYSRYTHAQDQYLGLLTERGTLMADNKVYQTRLNTLQGQLQVLTDTALLKVPMPGATGREQQLATVYWNRQTKDVYLISNNLPAAPAGKQYQLWAIVDGKPVDAGVLGDCASLCQLKNIGAAQAFAITLEQAGGSPAPDLTQLQVMGKVPS